MAIKYICDNCGEEQHDITELQAIYVCYYSADGIAHLGERVGQYCRECRSKIVKQIRDGVS